MSKIAVITDTHWGARGGSSLFREYMKEWWDSEFFRICKEQDIKIILHGGDFFDNRNSINLLDIDIVVNWFAEKLKELDLQFYVILGNHDVAHKNTNKIHSLALLKSSAPDNVHVIEEPKLIVLADQKFALVPWINNSNSDEILGFLDSVDSKESTIILGHFELAGFPMYKGGKVFGYNYSDINKRISKFVDVRVESQSDISNLVRALEDRIALLDTSP